ncbi:Uncharacterised protein [Escherichia coli]|uniref:Uncharacterized protein n=1 Tax=Escherichia coli TaxID=562 RepID=A0A377CES7_ECOLX|nr:Uncharacterised protein [Escherichia coli]
MAITVLTDLLNKGRNTDVDSLLCGEVSQIQGTMIPLWIVISAPSDRASSISGAVAHDSPLNGKNNPY